MQSEKDFESSIDHDQGQTDGANGSATASQQSKASLFFRNISSIFSFNKEANNTQTSIV